MSTRAHTVPKFYLRGFEADESKASQDPYLYRGCLRTGEIKRRSAKNISISRGLYDGPGAFADLDASVENHLAKIEWAAAASIRKLAADSRQVDAPVPAEIWRFLAWQAARTPGWMALVDDWAEDWDPSIPHEVIEQPPEGIDDILDRIRPLLLECRTTGELRETANFVEFRSMISNGWKWKLRNDDHLEMLHMQAWYFQVRHLRRLSWVRLTAEENSFVTSDRAVSWVADGYADTPPAALRHSTAQLVTTLTSSIALVGRHGTERLNVTPREVNRAIASAASEWIAGPSYETVEQAIQDRPATAKVFTRKEDPPTLD